jgi:hypothetical protein
MQPENFSDDEDEPLNLPVSEPPAAQAPIQVQKPLHIDLTTIEGFIPDQMRVAGNLTEVRAKYVRQRITEGNPIPQIPDPGASFTAFQEQEKRNKVQNDYSNKLSRAQKEIRDHHTKLEFRSAWPYLDSRSKSVEKVLLKQLQALKWKKGMPLSVLLERFNDLIKLCNFNKPQHQMTFFHEFFSDYNVKIFQDALLTRAMRYMRI